MRQTQFLAKISLDSDCRKIPKTGHPSPCLPAAVFTWIFKTCVARYRYCNPGIKPHFVHGLAFRRVLTTPQA